MNQKQIPVLYISHGGPITSFRDYKFQKKELVDHYVDTIEKMGEDLQKNYDIKRILIMSAHYEKNKFSIVSQPKPKTIHDHGFDFIKNYTFDNPGDAEYSQKVYNILKQNKIDSQLDDTWGFDHGVWSAVKMIDKEAKIPVINISVNNNFTPEEHIKVGQVLKQLRQDNTLIIGSGSIIHNLYEVQSHFSMGTPQRYLKNIEEFEAKIENIVLKQVGNERNQNAAVSIKDKNYKYCHPSDEHFFPIYLSIGAADQSSGRKFLEMPAEYGMSYGCYIFE